MTKLKQYLCEDITDEMISWYVKRTNRHINLVKKYAKKIENEFPEFKGLINQSNNHDASKLKEPEKTPYIYITWKYKMKDDGVDYKIPKDVDDSKATMHHIKNNSHHPEYHSDDETVLDRNNRDKANNTIDASNMSDLDIAEMCADWMGMSEERGNTPQEWADQVINKRWKFTNKQKNTIYKVLNTIWTRR